MSTDDSNDLLIELIIAVKKNNELQDENQKLRRQLIKEKIKYEENKKPKKHD